MPITGISIEQGVRVDQSWVFFDASELQGAMEFLLVNYPGNGCSSPATARFAMSAVGRLGAGGRGASAPT
jgi:hypothetical protein